MRNWLKTLLFLSAFSPALLSIAVSRYMSQGFCQNEIYYGACGIGGIALGACIMRFLQFFGETLTFTAKKIEATDATMLAVVATYVIPFVGKASEITFSVMVALTGLLALVLWVTSALIPHPVLRFIGFRFYKVESANGVVFTIITTRDLLDPTDIKRVKKITNSMLVEAK